MILQTMHYHLPDSIGNYEQFLILFERDPLIKAYYQASQAIIRVKAEDGGHPYGVPSFKIGPPPGIEIVRIWKTRADYDSYKRAVDAIVDHDRLNAFYEENGISTEETVQEI